MKKLFSKADAFIIGGFITNFFNGLVNPLYISQILANLDTRVLAAGSIIASAFPFLIGLVLESPKVFRRLYRVLPWVMAAEIGISLASVYLAELDLATYYLAAMCIFGIFSTSVVFLTQRIKEVRYSGDRTSFDRRSHMAEASGYLLGSIIPMTTAIQIADLRVLVALGVVQTALVYMLFLAAYRRVASPGFWSERELAAEDEDPHERPPSFEGKKKDPQPRASGEDVFAFFETDHAKTALSAA